MVLLVDVLAVLSCFVRSRQELTQERKNYEIEEQCTSRLIDEYQLLSSENVSSSALIYLYVL